MTKSDLTKSALEHAVLMEIRASYGCEDVTGVEVASDPFLQCGVNWRILTITRNSVSIAAATFSELALTSRAVEYAHKKLRNLYNLKL